ncbi:M23 family metallopeptidase [Parachitinimonas caeni]|uniref:Uncharacterized protein n=1 Tax=Parachitinimonas caeni TaxID=3031301 RepID=A0ABT7DT86_9NEIS|nr:hypothetical protein [Parachitinimonas caeni]MDK2123009.1 hypothetical protein [Parachitinimonas caeni]
MSCKLALPVLMILTAGSSLAMELQLPLDPADAAFNFLGVAGFGYHVAEHRLDGHPGLDFEFTVGAKVRAGHAGTLNAFTDSHDPTKMTVQIDFTDEGKSWRNVYTNISGLEPGITNGSKLSAGQVFGTAGTVTAKNGSNTIQYAMTHFQLDDMSGVVSFGLSNKTALSPVPYFSTSARAALDTLVAKSTYPQQVCEPSLSTPRGLLSYPTLQRRWTLSQGSHATSIEFTCNYASQTAGFGYTFYDSKEAVLETGTVTMELGLSSVPKLDFTASNGSKRLGVYKINGSSLSLQLDYSAPGGARPTDFSAASSYSTVSAMACATATDVVCLVGEASPYRTGSTIDLNLALRADQLAMGVSKVDLWLALLMPTGQLLYLGSNGLGGSPEAFRTEVSAKNQQFPLFASVPAGMVPAGNYTIYAVAVPTGTPADQLLDKKLGNLLTVVTQVAP